MPRVGRGVRVSCDTRPPFSFSARVHPQLRLRFFFLFPYVSPVGPMATLSNVLLLGCVSRSLEGEVQEQEENSPPVPSTGGDRPADRISAPAAPASLQGRHWVWESQQHFFTCCSRGSSDSTPRQGIFLFLWFSVGVIFGTVQNTSALYQLFQ